MRREGRYNITSDNYEYKDKHTYTFNFIRVNIEIQYKQRMISRTPKNLCFTDQMKKKKKKDFGTHSSMNNKTNDSLDGKN